MHQHQPSGEQTTVPLFYCSQCPKAYKRSEHLQRHVAVHKPTREYRCARCGATFQRSDVLSRHIKTCDGEHSRRGSLLRRACDACIRSKRKCSFNPPCVSCKKRSTPCTFSSVPKSDTVTQSRVKPTEEDIETSSFDILPSVNTASENGDLALMDDDLWTQFFSKNLSELMADDLNWTSLGTERKHEERSLRFLESFTRNTGFLDSFDCLTPADRIVAYETFTSRLAVSKSTDHELRAKSFEIVSLIQEAIEVKPRNNPITLTWSQDLQRTCMDFFSPQNIRLWLDLYWAIWHPNVNFMHRPTFEIERSKPCLLSTMCIIGALVSPNESDQASARLWMNSVEEVVFRDDDVCYTQQNRSFPNSGRLQAMQAMYMVCLFQNWEGDDSSKSRIRRFRYSTMVANARDIGIHHAQHPPYHILRPSAFAWHSFVAREQLIRILMWIFLLDTAFVIFNNVPPRMAVKEMNMHLASSEACFQAPTSEICYQYLQGGPINGTNLLSTLTAAMCKGPIAYQTQLMLGDVGSLNMFALTSVIFQTQQAFGLETELGPVRNALDNWGAIWHIYSTSYANSEKHCPLLHVGLTPDNMWQRIGFMRFAPEYWLLAKLMVDRIMSRASQRESVSMINSAEMLPEDESGSTPTILNKYDETSMRQVNDLIADFQQIAL